MIVKAKVQRAFDSGSILAICDVTLDDALVIHGVKYVDGLKGTFVSMPSSKRKNKKGETIHTDIAHPVSSECRSELIKAVKKAYDEYYEDLVKKDLPF